MSSPTPIITPPPKRPKKRSFIIEESRFGVNQKNMCTLHCIRFPRRHWRWSFSPDCAMIWTICERSARSHETKEARSS